MEAFFYNEAKMLHAGFCELLIKVINVLMRLAVFGF